MFNSFEDHIDVLTEAKVTPNNGYYRQRKIPVKIFVRIGKSAIVEVPEHPRLLVP